MTHDDVSAGSRAADDGARRAGEVTAAGATARAEPLVLAFVDHWSPARHAAALGSIRRELRGLGFALAVVSAEGAWRLGATTRRRSARASSTASPSSPAPTTWTRLSAAGRQWPAS